MKGQQPDRLLPPEGVAPPLSRHDAALLRMWRLVAWIAGVFSALVGLMMLAGYFRTPTIDPLKSPELKAYKEQLRLNPADEDLKQRIRQVDLQLRQRYFRLLSQRESGVYLLLGGAAVFVFAACRYALKTAGFWSWMSCPISWVTTMSRMVIVAPQRPQTYGLASSRASPPWRNPVPARSEPRS